MCVGRGLRGIGRQNESSKVLIFIAEFRVSSARLQARRRKSGGREIYRERRGNEDIPRDSLSLGLGLDRGHLRLGSFFLALSLPFPFYAFRFLPRVLSLSRASLSTLCAVFRIPRARDNCVGQESLYAKKFFHHSRHRYDVRAITSLSFSRSFCLCLALGARDL